MTTKMAKFSLLLLFSIAILFSSEASAKTTYIIKKGDNLYDIAKKFHVSAKDIESANKVNAKNLKPGTKLVIPVKEDSSRTAKKEPSGKKSAATAANANTKNAKPDIKTAKHQTEMTDKEPSHGTSLSPGEKKYHVVKKGDTLKSISKKYNTPVSDIKNMNAMHSNKLKAGQKLVVKLQGPRTYTVQKGDNLWRIAKNFDMDPEDLMELNEMKTQDLKIGQRLYLDEKPEVANIDRKYIVMATNIEDELKKMPESPEFAEKSSQDKVTTFAKKLLNIPYKFGGNTILGIDCSGYVKKVYGLMGVSLPRTAREQFNEGQEIEKEDLSVGDLVFFRTYASFPSHVGIYLGNNLFIHASSKGKKVTIDNLDTPYYVKRFIGAKRLISASEDKERTAADPAS